MEDAPRSLRSEVEQARRRAMLSRSHMMPLATYAAGLRRRGLGDVPDFDPYDGGTGSRALFLFEKPGPKAFKSGFISRNNNDSTAENTFQFMLAAGLPREYTCLWNIVPFWNGTIDVSTSELEVGVSCLNELLALLPKLKVAVLVGRKAERAMPLLSRVGLTILTSVHPSPKNRAMAPNRWLTIPSDWARVKTCW